MEDERRRGRRRRVGVGGDAQPRGALEGDPLGLELHRRGRTRRQGEAADRRRRRHADLLGGEQRARGDGQLERVAVGARRGEAAARRAHGRHRGARGVVRRGDGERIGRAGERHRASVDRPAPAPAAACRAPEPGSAGAAGLHAHRPGGAAVVALGALADAAPRVGADDDPPGARRGRRGDGDPGPQDGGLPAAQGLRVRERRRRSLRSRRAFFESRSTTEVRRADRRPALRMTARTSTRAAGATTAGVARTPETTRSARTGAACAAAAGPQTVAMAPAATIRIVMLTFDSPCRRRQRAG